MQTFIIRAAILVLLCVSCQQPRSTGTVGAEAVADSLDSWSAQPVDSGLLQERQQKIASELDYYLSRHNVSDEGFEMVARYAERGDSSLQDYLPAGPITPLGMLRWRSVQRRGVGVERLPDGGMVYGHWHADTLTTGMRLDTTGIYAGQFDRYRQAHGHGTFRSTDGSYYEGHYERNLRSGGFGFSISPTNLLAGIWRDGRFLGERMSYTSDRIYGIDISRYQHEVGRKKYPISWYKLRINSLGRKARQNIKGAVDYPVSFVYVKATEGLSIHNRYYAADHAAARREGIKVGAYHFFSTRQSGRLQANYFLSQAVLSNGDLPPMLDIEPSDALIKQMGGPERLFQEVRAWIEVVERRTGARPLLYVNQRFVKKYLDLAPDLKQNYLIWIARYGEYKPDLHLAIWQLSADGRVRGIFGEVDINVFNGYEGQWNEFLQHECIRR